MDAASTFPLNDTTTLLAVLDDDDGDPELAANLNGTAAVDYSNYSAPACFDEFHPDEAKLEFYVYGIGLNLMGLIGIMGNIVTMIIMSRPQMRSSINYLLIGLARSDTILIIAAIILFGVRAINPYTGYFRFYNFYLYPLIAPFVYPISAASQTASSYLTLMVSLERYVAVCHPLRARALCTYGRSRYYVLFCAIFAILYNLIKVWESQVIDYHSPLMGDIKCVLPSALRQNRTYISVYIHWCYLVVNYFIPFSGLVVFNVLIFRQVQKANRERQRLSRSERREMGLATMLLAVVVAFFALNILALVVNVCEAFYQHIDDNMIVLTNMCVTLNSCVNFVIYVIFGEKFKRLFFTLFCKCLQDTAPDGLIHDDSSFSNGGGGAGGGGGGGADGFAGGGGGSVKGHGPGGSCRQGSQRITRHGTTRSSRNGMTTTTCLGTSLKVKQGRVEGGHKVRGRAASPSPSVYYPARDVQRAACGWEVPVTSLGADDDLVVVTVLGDISKVRENNNGVATSGF